VDAAATTVAEVIAAGRVVYGINTGFGQLAKTRIQPDELEELQRSIVLSHAAGVGSLMDESTVRLMLVLKINSLARGYSGIRLEVIQRLVTLLNAEVYPAIPRKGSVGASGDLAPLAHISALLLGEGEALYRGERIGAGQALEIAGIRPVQLAPKEGLALLNGTQASTAYALQGLFAAENALKSAAVIGAMTIEAARGSRVPFDARIHEIRGNAAQCDMAVVYRVLLETESEISRSHRTVIGCRTPTRCAASPRSWVPACSNCALPQAPWWRRPTGFPTTHWCSATAAIFSPAVTFTPSRWQWLRTCWRSRWRKSARCPNGASPC